MAKDIRVKMHPKGAIAILRDDGVLADMRRRAEAIATRAGDGMEVNTGLGRKRARAEVVTGTVDAMAAEAKDRALTRALDAGR